MKHRNKTDVPHSKRKNTLNKSKHQPITNKNKHWSSLSVQHGQYELSGPR